MTTKTDDTCAWHGDTEDGYWDTDCGHDFDLNEGSPDENHMQFCCFCGRRLVTDLVTNDEDNDDDQD